MKNLQQVTTTLRKGKTPYGMPQKQWANAMNWTIEAWRCYLAGQKWMHPFEICAPEQYYALLNEQGNLIIDDTQLLQFKDNALVRKWVVTLRQQIQEMRLKGEYNEAIRWAAVRRQIEQHLLPSPNEVAFAKHKQTLKGHRLIRIKAVA